MRASPPGRDRLLVADRAALGAIWVYQRFLSRRKGYRCAYSLLHGGTGCSGYVKFAIRDHGVFGAIPAIRRRFDDCRVAAAELSRRRRAVRMQQTEDESEGDQKTRKSGCMEKVGNGLDCISCDCGSGVFRLFGKASKADADPGCDCTPDGCDCTPSCH